MADLGHKDRLSAMDTGLLDMEGERYHMHVGAVMLFEGPAPTYAELKADVESRLHLVPRYRQRLAFPPLESGRPVWVDDPSFRLEYHVRRTALPEPCGEAELKELAARLFSQQLDRYKPLWEMYFVEDVKGGRWALVTKNHHCLIDGVSGVDLATVLMDAEPKPREAAVPRGWEPQSAPTSVELLLDGVADRLKEPVGVARAALRAGLRPRRALRRLTASVGGIGDLVWSIVNPAPVTPLNVEIGPHRVFDWVEFPLADFKRVKDALGGTVNDVVLAVSAGALVHFFDHRGFKTEGLEPRAMVPISIRREDERGQFGNRIVVVQCPLPVYAHDPVERLDIVRESMEDLKQSRQALGVKALTSLEGFMPPTLLSATARLNYSARLFNLLITNIPGPQIPLYICGRRMESAFPIPFLAGNHAVAIAIVSYDGELSFGLLGDYDHLQDVDVLRDGLAMAVSEMLELAKAAA